MTAAQEQLAAQRLQVLRTIDKHDRIGTQGVFEALTTGRTDKSGDVILGCGLSNGQALGLIHSLQLDKDAPALQRRLDLMCALDAIETGNGLTAWDRLLSLPTCERNTWENGQRPANIAWALDDIYKCLAAEHAAREGGQ